MPNWCSNKLTISGNKEAIDAFVKALGSDKLFSFGKLFPIPDPLKTVILGFLKGKDCKWRNITDSEGNVTQQVLSAEELEELKDKYKATNWYDWNISNWGTKWDIEPVELEGDFEKEVYCHFDTAWAPPVEFITHIGKQFPELTFTLYFAEGGVGFWGTSSVSGDMVETIKNETFWKNEIDGDAEDYTTNCVEELQEFLNEHGLHTGG